MHKAAITTAAALTLATGAVLLTRQSAVQTESRRLVWDWTPTPGNDWGNVVFIVRECKTNRVATPSTNWPCVAVVQTNSWRFDIDKSATAVWFAVQASNTVTGDISDLNR